MKKFKYLILLIIIICLTWFGFNLWQDSLLQPLQKNAAFQEITIESSADSVASKLQEKGLIKSSWAFKNYLNSIHKNIVGDTYYLSSQMNAKDIANVITHQGDAKYDVSYFVRYNQTINQMAPELDLSLQRSSLRLKKLAKDANFINKLANKFSFINTKKMLNPQIDYYLEGYLISGYYKINLTWSYEKIVMKLLEQTQKMYDKYQSSLGAKNLSFHGLLTLSSCLSAEVGVYKDQYKDVAGVFWNRINKYMPLQLDATYIYGYNHGINTRNNVENLSLSQMRIKDDSLYNTYNNSGLPVGPITSVSEQQIQAILNPSKHDYLYYYHYDDNNERKIKFSKTYAEHIKK